VEIDEELEKLLDTFWTEHPTWPESDAGPSSPKGETDDQLLSLHRLLSAIDPKEAGRWHWRDGRKVRRGIERWWENATGKTEGKPKGRKAR
jgi:tRNA dimethylallyltransferase